MSRPIKAAPLRTNKKTIPSAAPALPADLATPKQIMALKSPKKSHTILPDSKANSSDAVNAGSTEIPTLLPSVAPLKRNATSLAVEPPRKKAKEKNGAGTMFIPKKPVKVSVHNYL